MTNGRKTVAETVSELLPCPFCGVTPPYVHEVDYCTPSEWTVLCPSNDCGRSRATKADAIAAWNRRAPDPIIEEILNAAGKEATQGPQAYQWGWADAMQAIHEKISHPGARRGNGLVREVAADEKIAAPSAPLGADAAKP